MDTLEFTELSSLPHGSSFMEFSSGAVLGGFMWAQDTSHSMWKYSIANNKWEPVSKFPVHERLRLLVDARDEQHFWCITSSGELWYYNIINEQIVKKSRKVRLII